MTERQAFQMWVLAVSILGMGVGVALTGVNVAADRSIGEPAPGALEFLIVGSLIVFAGYLILRGVPRSLKPFQRFAKDKEAVSPVVAVVLMVAITVVLAGLVFALLSNGPSEAETPPVVEFDKGDASLTVVSMTRAVDWKDLEVHGCRFRAVDPATEVGGEVRIGDELLECSGHVTVAYKPSNVLVYSTDF